MINTVHNTVHCKNITFPGVKFCWRFSSVLNVSSRCFANFKLIPGNCSLLHIFYWETIDSSSLFLKEMYFLSCSFILNSFMELLYIILFPLIQMVYPQTCKINDLKAWAWTQVHDRTYCIAVSIRSSTLTQFWIMPKGTVVFQTRVKRSLWNSVSWRLVPVSSRDEAILPCGGRVHGFLMTALSCLLCSEAENGSFPILFTRIKAVNDPSF